MEPQARRLVAGLVQPAPENCLVGHVFFGTVQKCEKAPLQFDSRQVAPERIRLGWNYKTYSRKEATCNDSLFDIRTLRQRYLV